MSHIIPNYVCSKEECEISYYVNDCVQENIIETNFSLIEVNRVLSLRGGQ